MAVGSIAPYTLGMECDDSSLPPNSTLAPGMASSFWACASIASVVHDSTGPMVRSCGRTHASR
eukprot:361501-Chlamydomonas_euryale.AAC.1